MENLIYTVKALEWNIPCQQISFICYGWIILLIHWWASRDHSPLRIFITTKGISITSIYWRWFDSSFWISLCIVWIFCISLWDMFWLFSRNVVCRKWLFDSDLVGPCTLFMTCTNEELQSNAFHKHDISIRHCTV